ncbi:MAG: hypothetical protein KH175_09155, partial [Collinsella sp.]|nr:hypothetical protein [Collinsella sp.]
MPYAELCHYEFTSRGREEANEEKLRRWKREQALFMQRWPEFKTLVCWPRSGQLQPTRYAGGDKRLYKATPPTDIDDCSGRQEFESKGWSPW